MAKYTVNMADQLMKVRTNTQEKLRKEAEVVVEVEKPSALQTAAASHLSKKDEHPLSQNLNEETINENSLADVTKRLKAKKIGVKTITRTKDKVTHLYVHVNDVDDAQKILKNDPLYVAGKLRVVAKEETLHEDEKNALAGFDNRVREAGSMDRKDIIKAKELYKRKDVKGLRKHIYSLDTAPLEAIMQNISMQDRKFFDKMYPNNKSGQFLAQIAFDHKKMDEELDEKREPESKSDFLKRNKKAGYAAADKKIAQMKKDRMKGAKLKLKMGESLDEKFVDKDPQGKKFGWVIFNTKTKELIAKADDKKTIEKMKQRFERMGEPVTMMTFSKAFQYNEEVIKEDGHTDVASAVRQCKTIVEDATQMMSKLQSMSGEDSLPSWWTNKLAVASNSMNKMRDYLLVPSMQEGLNENVNSDIKKILDKEKISYKIHTSKHSLGQKGIITGVFVKAKDERQARIALGKVSPYPHTITVHAEGVDLDEREKGIDKLPRQFLNPDKEVMVMKKNKVIVIDKKDQDRYTKQGWELAEVLDKEDEPKVKKIIKKLKGASDAHAGQAKDLEKAVNEWFKSKNTDVKVRKLDESIQVYVPLGRRIPNEIREELITTQYGKMPEDVKNVKDISYGNFKENSITMNNDFWNKVLHGTKGE